jgi:hypothetical protein
MATVYLEGLSRGTVDEQNDEVTFTLRTKDGDDLSFIADVSSARQIAHSLGRMSLQAGQQTPQTLSAEKIKKYGVKREAFGQVVLLQLVDEHDIPYMFAVPLDAAKDIAARLQTESAKSVGTGRA